MGAEPELDQLRSVCRFCKKKAIHSLRGKPLCCEHYNEALEHGADIELDLTALAEMKRRANVHTNQVASERHWRKTHLEQARKKGREGMLRWRAEHLELARLRDVARYCRKKHKGNPK